MDLPMDQNKLKDLIANFPTGQLQSDEIEPFIQQMRKHLIEQCNGYLKSGPPGII